MLALFWFIVIIFPIIFIHELGHFLFARLLNVKVEIFSIGFGQSLIEWRDHKKTVWKIATVPLGGFVILSKKTLSSKNLWQKFLIIFGGPLFNYLFSLLILIFIAMSIKDKDMIIEIDNSRATNCLKRRDFETGDIIIRVDDKKINSLLDLKKKMASLTDSHFIIGIIRNNYHMNLDIISSDKNIENVFRYSFLKTSREVSFISICTSSIKQITKISHTIMKSMYKLIIHQNNNITGPIKLSIYSNRIANQGILSLMYLIAISSLNIGFINMIPLPMLDGGHLLFCGIESITKKHISYSIQSLLFKINFYLLTLLMLIIFWKDLKDTELL